MLGIFGAAHKQLSLMPELPEVEVTRRGLAPQLTGRIISAVEVREPRLRWPVPQAVRKLAGRTVRAVERRGKYLLVDCGDGHLILHLGMSGSLRVLPPGTPAQKHDHFDLVLGDRVLRLRDPRRFGAVLWTADDVHAHPLIANLGVEPLSRALDPARLHALTRKHRAPIKQFLMDGRRIVGVGNIYASESLFLAGIDPRKPANRLSLARCARLAKAIKHTLARACVTTSLPTASSARRKAATGSTSAKASRAGAAERRSSGSCRASARPTTARAASVRFLFSA